jgi:hypothetical protein
MPEHLKNLIDEIKINVLTEGDEQKDPRWNRTVKSFKLPVIKLNDEGSMDYLKSAIMRAKYNEDWKRCEESLLYCITEQRKDSQSRRLVVSNMDSYLDVFPCFMTMQFISINENSYILAINQRSADIEKMHDDLVFFGNVAKKFELGTDKKVTEFDLFYGDLHCKTK